MVSRVEEGAARVIGQHLGAPTTEIDSLELVEFVLPFVFKQSGLLESLIHSLVLCSILDPTN